MKRFLALPLFAGGARTPLRSGRWRSPRDDLFAIFMVQAPSQNGRQQLALKTLIYQALGKD